MKTKLKKALAKSATIFGAALVSVAFAAHVYLIKEQSKCERSGGDYVRVTISTDGVAKVCEANK